MRPFRTLSRSLIQLGKALVRSVAFLPVPMMVLGLIMGVVLYYLEQNTGATAYFDGRLPSVVVSSQDTARSALGLFIAGLLTLVVFTFTQMMTLYNQVANTYSPRLLQQFTGARSLQATMGFYLGTMLMNLIVMLSIGTDDSGNVPLLSVLVCVTADVISVMLFVYFVATASNKIHADAIIMNTYKLGRKYLKEELALKGFSERQDQPDTRNWFAVPTPMDGFIGSIAHHDLSELAGELNTRFYIGSIKGEYIPRSFPVIESERELSEKEAEEVIKLVSPVSRKYHDWYLPQLQLLVEIAMKAMSPGINDPGTAHTAIDRINGMLGHLMYIPNYNFVQVDGGGEVWFARKDYGDILHQTFVQLRNYSRRDTMVTRSLIKVVFQLIGGSHHNEAMEGILRDELIALVADARKYISNDHDRSLLAKDIFRWRRRTHELLYATPVINDNGMEEKGIPLEDTAIRI